MNETIVDGIDRYWLSDNTVAAYMFHRIDDERAEVLSQSIMATLHDWPPDVPFRVIFNVSIAGSSMNYMMATSEQVYNVGVTEEGRAAVDAFLAEHPDFRIHLALVLSKAISGQKVYVSGAKGETHHPQITGGMFFDMEHALDWVLDQP
jgi:hypothetical protein